MCEYPLSLLFSLYAPGTQHILTRSRGRLSKECLFPSISSNVSKYNDFACLSLLPTLFAHPDTGMCSWEELSGSSWL